MRRLLLIAAVALSGCASLPGVEMTDEEKVACEAEGCTVWTKSELEQLVGMAMQRGFAAGKQVGKQSRL